MRALLFMFVFFHLGLLPAQKEQVFKVSKKVILTPDEPILGYNLKYQFVLEGINPKDITRVYFEDGLASFTGPVIDIWVYPKIAINPDGPVLEPTLKIFGTTNGKEFILYKKQFTLGAADPMSLKPEPTTPSLIHVFSFGIPLQRTDSIPVDRLSFSNGLYVFNSGRTNIEYAVTSFKLTITHSKVIQAYSTVGNQLSIQMTDALGKLQKGDKVLLSDIHYKCINASPDDLVAGPFELMIKAE